MEGVKGPVIVFFFVSFFVSTLEYDLGQTYVYDYTTTIRLSEPREGATEVVYQIAADVEVSTVWQDPNDLHHKLLLLKAAPRLRVTPRGATELKDHSSPLDKDQQRPVLLTIRSGKIEKLFVADKEEDDVLNLKRGIASLLQFQNKNEETQEVDASGTCSVTYKSSGRNIMKTKRNCKFPTNKEPVSHSNSLLGAEVISHSETNYEIARDQNIIQSAESEEDHVLIVQMKRQAASTIRSQQKMLLKKQQEYKYRIKATKLKDAVKAASKNLKTTFIDAKITLSERPKTCTENCKPLFELVKEFDEPLNNDNLGKLRAARAFLRVLQRFRISNQQDLYTILRKYTYRKCIQSLLDAIAATRTPEANKAIFQYLKEKEYPEANTERYLVSLSLIPEVDEGILEELFEISKQELKNKKVKETVNIVLGNAIRKTCKGATTCQDKKFVPEILALWKQQYEKCRKDPCKQTILRAYRNAAIPETLPFLIQEIRTQNKKLVTEALRTIQNMPNEVLKDEVKNVLAEVYHQIKRKYDTTSRLIAAEILLTRDPIEDDVQAILRTLADHTEFSTFLLAKIKEWMRSNAHFKDMIHIALNKMKLHNYHLLAQPGISTAFTRTLADTNEANGTYAVSLELAPGGLMKYSTFDLKFSNEDDSVGLQFSLFASGLSGIAGEAPPNAEPEEDEDVTAGLELNVNGVYLRPYVFFNGQGELMGHVWAGSASELTPILQGNYLLQDHWQQVGLQSGLVVDLTLIGVLSVDMKGAVQISLWNRNAHNEVIDSLALLVQGSAKLDTSFIQSQVDFFIASEAGLSFITDADFYDSPFKMCTQMTQPAFTMKYNVKKIEQIPGSKHYVRRTRKQDIHVPGKSYVLHPKNSELCAIMLNK